MRRGPKGTPPERKKAAGTERPDRGQVLAFPGDPEAGWVEPKRPTWLSPLSRQLWKTKVDRYRRRNQRVVGFEDSLAAYCALEAEIISSRKAAQAAMKLYAQLLKKWKETQVAGVTEDPPEAPSTSEVPAALVSQHRMWAAEFYDTPAAQKVASSTAKPANRFAANAAHTRGGRRNVNAAG